jgi:hypothetical protein
MANVQRTLLACACVFLASGCNIPVPVTRTEGADFNKSVKEVSAKLRESLSEIQSVEVAVRVDAFAAGNQRTLERLNLDPKLSDAEVKVITCQFDFLVGYSEALKDATTPGTSWDKSVSGINSAESKLMGDTQGLDNKYVGRAVITDTNVATFNADAGRVAKVFAAIGQAALTLYGEEMASKIAAQVDPDLQKYCADLEGLLGPDTDSRDPGAGLAGILHADYEERIASLKYLATTAVLPSGPDDPNYFVRVRERAAILNEYTALVEREKTGVARVLALRKAVAEIASAHAALAHKDNATFKEKLSNAEALARSLAPGGADTDK